MKIMIFLHGTTIMHKGAAGHTREEIVKQSKSKRDLFLFAFKSYIPIGSAVEKIKTWQNQGAEITYLSSHRFKRNVEKDRFVLKKYGFPEGQIYHRKFRQAYKNIVEHVMPDILIEDNCESIGGKRAMTYTHVDPKIKSKIKPIAVKEFSGIDHLPDKLNDLLNYKPQKR